MRSANDLIRSTHDKKSDFNVQNTAISATSGKPPIHLIDSEYDMIADLALGIVRQAPELAKMLLDEIDRAEIHARGKLPGDVVSLGSEVEVLDEKTGVKRQLRLVLPIEAHVETGRVSILTPMGAGLIGLRQGQSIEWPYLSGDSRTLKILEVRQPAA
jgi:regulator of nucleoside diphosphate kinase